MQRYLLSRLAQSLLVLFGVLVLVFMMLRLTGDPASLMVSREAPPEQIEELRKAMGFDRPLIVQFVDFAAGALTGDFGNSLHYRLPAMPLILERLPATIHLASVALLMAVVVGIPLGVIAGSNPGSAWDSIGRVFGLLGQSTPNFWLALLLIILFAVNLGWFPSFGRDEPKSVILPAFALSVFTMGQLVRLTRSAVLEIRGEDYIRTANSKGLAPRRIYVRHVLRNAAIPLVSVLGVQFGYLLSGSIYIETIFSWPGLGRLLADSIGVRDFPMVQAIAFFTSVVVVALNLLTDVAYAVIDPRIRYGS
ncbi:MAG: ABC transporter permease [Anaerolineae bacterium]